MSGWGGFKGFLWDINYKHELRLIKIMCWLGLTLELRVITLGISRV